MHFSEEILLKHRLKALFDLLLANKIPHQLHQEFMEKAYIAGGCIRSMILKEDIKDIDIFFKADNELFDLLRKAKIGFATSNAITFNIASNKFQLCFTHVDKPDVVVDQFDYTFNINYYDPVSHKLRIEDISAIKEKRLVVNRDCRNPLGTLGRLHKFVERGYQIPSKMDLMFLAVAISEKELVSFEDLETESKLYFSREEYNSVCSWLTLEDGGYSKTRSGRVKFTNEDNSGSAP